MSFRSARSLLSRMFAGVLAVSIALPVLAIDLQKQLTFDIPPQSLTSALLQFGRQAKVQIMSAAKQTDERSSRGVNGKLTLATALDKLLQGTGLHYRAAGDGTITIVGDSTAGMEASSSMQVVLLTDGKSAASTVGSASDAVEDGRSSDETRGAGIPEILVEGKRTLNTDIERTEDAPQPYVVFSRDEIERSQAVNLDDFLRTRLPMNATAGNMGQNTASPDTTSSVNLRGLGANQTLILVDGRRMPSASSFDMMSQPDINGIPLAAIERVEVLPSTAGGIYGGSATGGVVNVILRRDFQGLEARVTYGNTFDTDTAQRRIDLNAGFTLEGGRTQIMMAASHSQGNTLTVGDRDFVTRGIALQMRNNPSAIMDSFVPLLGATVNIRSTFGEELELDDEYGGTALGSDITHIPLGYRGPDSDNGRALVDNAGAFNLDIARGMFGRDMGLVAAPSVESFMVNVRRQFSDRVEAFVDVSQLDNEGSSFGAAAPSSAANFPADSVNNPFKQNINVRYPTPGFKFPTHSDLTTLRGTAGVIVRLPHQWMGELDYGWSRSRAAVTSTGLVIDSAGSRMMRTGIAPADGRPLLNPLQEGNTFPLDFSPYLLPSPNSFQGPTDTILKDATLRFSGPVLDLPGGPLTLSTLIERRKEQVDHAFYQDMDSVSREYYFTFYPARGQDADSYYLEARAPVLRNLEFQASVRRDDYETRNVSAAAQVILTSLDEPLPELDYDFSRLHSTDYTVGFRFSPLESVTVRASFGTGFLPPSVTQISSIQEMADYPIGEDPKRGFTEASTGELYTLIYGGNANLRPEQSESLSAGVILTPSFAPGFRVSLDYTRIEKTDEIQYPGFDFLLAYEDELPGRIVRGPNIPGDETGWAGPIVSIDQTTINIASTTVEAYDFQADYLIDSAASGEWRWYAVATWQPHFENQLLPGAPIIDSAGYNGGALKWRGNLGLDWRRGPVKLGWNMQYYDSYFVYSPRYPDFLIEDAVFSQGSEKIPTQSYHDLIASYRFDASSSFVRGLLADSEISFGIQNVLNQSPPILASTSATDSGYSPYGDPRLRRYTLSLRKNF